MHIQIHASTASTPITIKLIVRGFKERFSAFQKFMTAGVV